MGRTGTLLFIPFMLLLVGYFVFLYFKIRQPPQADRNNEHDRTEGEP